jgi:hypothetical protein
VDYIVKLVRAELDAMAAREEALLGTHEPIVTPEHTLRAAGITRGRQARYQRRMSSLLAGRD